MENLKIINLSVDGLRKLKAVELTFKENGLTQILGENEQGKSTIIDAINILIRGNRFANKDIVQKGKSKATLVGQIGPYKISRIIPKDGTPTLKAVDTRTGEALKGRVQDFLDTLINELTFNPRPFLDKNKSEKLKFMMDLCKIDFSGIDKEIDILYNKRKVVGQEIDRYGEIIVPKKVSRINTSSILEQKKIINEENSKLKSEYEEKRNVELAEIEAFNKLQRRKNEEIKEANAAIDLDKKDIKLCTDEIAELEMKLENAKRALVELEGALDRHNTHLGSLPKPEPELPIISKLPVPEFKSVDDLDKKLEQAAEINQKANEYESKLERLNEKESKEKERRELTEEIDKLRKQKLETLAGTKTGVEGLAITEEDILYSGISSDNWSDAQGLTISRKLCIAQKPMLSAVFLDRAESMSKKTLKEFVDWAESEGIQTIITKVTDEAPSKKEEGVYFIVDGSIVESEEE